MSKIKIQDMKGAAVGDYDVSDKALVLDKGQQAVRDVVVAMMAGRRAGTASTLTKGNVAGSNAKPWKQKGLGRARAGYRQSPVWRGGAVVFGPLPRSYDKKVNKKVQRLAFKRALSEALNEGRIRVLEELTLAEPKTKLFADIIKSLGIERAALFVDTSIETNVAIASRNIPLADVEEARNVNVYQLLRYDDIVVTRSGMEILLARLEGKSAQNDDGAKVEKEKPAEKAEAVTEKPAEEAVAAESAE